MDNIQRTDSEPTMVLDEHPFPSLVLSSAWVVAYIPIQQLFITALVVAMTYTHPDINLNNGMFGNNGNIIFGGLILAAAPQIFLMWLYLRRDHRARKLGLRDWGRLSISRTLYITVGAIFLAAIFNVFYANIVLSGQPMQDEMTKLIASTPRTPLNISLIILAITVIAPIIEELLFRGLLQNALMRHLPAWGAIIITAFAFSVIHFQLLAMPALMALGAAFGYIYYKTGSLKTTIILHMANNAFALVVSQIFN
jgi:membrane protease YdiL (CAAX protease family)